MAQENIESFIEIAKDYARAEKELGVQKMVFISIERKENNTRIRLYHYDLPREVYERRRYVIEWRKAKCICQYPKGDVQVFFHFYDKRLGLDNHLNEDLNTLISAKAQITKVQRQIDKYIDYNKGNLFFNEETDADLQKAREKLSAKISNVKAAEERMKLKIIQIEEQNGKDKIELAVCQRRI